MSPADEAAMLSEVQGGPAFPRLFCVYRLVREGKAFGSRRRPSKLRLWRYVAVATTAAEAIARVKEECWTGVEKLPEDERVLWYAEDDRCMVASVNLMLVDEGNIPLGMRAAWEKE